MNDNGPDFCDELGAQAVKRAILAYWADKPNGDRVQVDIYPAPFSQTMRAAHYVVRSNLVGGLPPREALPSPAETEQARDAA